MTMKTDNKRRRKLTKKELIAALEECAESADTEAAHSEADSLLVEFVNDKKIAEAYSKVDKWYA